MKLRDGHVHSPYCPHGTKDSFKMYIERALKLGYTELSFTEHAPLPPSFEDPAPERDSGMKLEFLERYLFDLSLLKNEYKKDLIIHAGLEIDYIEGFEEETSRFIAEYGPALDDSILSVHFLLKDGNYDCMDFSDTVFSTMVTRYGSVDQVHDAYYQTVLASVKADLGPFKPKRIGHMTLSRKFQHRFKPAHSHKKIISGILHEIKKGEYELDYNGAGIFKPYCLEPYPSDDIVKEAFSLGIPLVYGSDAHQSKDLHQGRDQLLFPDALS
ncbi:histidinol-phosphatase HisJ [Jeotgalibacillus campisalis]|uniref:Histidinol-phosphatase n=1 Tax=Jeotgalibacillus campisalis TaxID=220754 RepID=A0A0C2R7X0_9BACL|nr:histidinol-phosphatase HisJ [Jeotgalibacillus campisalis]KIL46340.1 histidinol-phosphatase [Jeotgalibacillus campisalis]